MRNHSKFDVPDVDNLAERHVLVHYTTDIYKHLLSPSIEVGKILGGLIEKAVEKHLRLVPH